MIISCAWKKSNTTKSGTHETPDFCKQKGCDGVLTEGIMKTCDKYIPLRSMENVLIQKDKIKNIA